MTALEDERLRAAFEVALKQFLTTLDIVMPRPESLPFNRDAKFFGMVQVRARRRYREGDAFDVSLYGDKVRSLIDDHVLALGVEQKIPPVSITAPDFRSKVGGLRTDRAKASEMEHAVRYHIRKHFDEDPAHYAKLSEKLDKILEALKEQWDQLALALSDLVDEALKGRQVDSTGLDPQTEAPFYGLLGQELEAEATDRTELVIQDAPPAELSPAQTAVLRNATITLVAHIRTDIAVVGFWQNAYAQGVLRRWVVQHLDGQQVDGYDLFSLDRLPEVADKVVELARGKPREARWPSMSSATRTPSPSAPARLAVAGLEFEVQLTAGRRSIEITVDRDGSLIVSAPQDSVEADLAAFAYENRLWIYKKLAEKDLLPTMRPAREFITGEGFAYLGRSHRLILRDGAPSAVKLERGRLVMRRDVAASERASAAIVDWYRTRALRWLPRRVTPWAERMGVRPSAVDVRDLGYRWGSLGKSDRINFHWATIQLSPPLIDYVIVHELAHIREPNHTPDFWLRVERAMPGYLASKATLAAVGSQLWLGDKAADKG